MTIHWFTRILTTITLHGAQRIHPIWIGFSTYRNASSESFVELNFLPILHLFFGLLKSLTFLTLMRSFLCVLCTHIIMTSFLIRLTPPLLLIAKYTHIILETDANNYQPYFGRTNIKQFTILYLGPSLRKHPFLLGPQQRRARETDVFADYLGP